MYSEPPHNTSVQVMNQKIKNIIHFKAEDLSDNMFFVQSLPEKFNLQQCFSDPIAVQQHLEKEPVDVLIIDTNISIVNHTSLIRTLLVKRPQLNLLVYTASQHTMDVMSSFRMGVKGYLLKPKEPKEVIRYIEMVSQGNIVLDECLAHDFQSSLQSQMQEHFFSELTHRENHIIWLVAQGLKNNDIAQECNITEKTVRNCISKALKKLGFRDRREVIKKLRDMQSNDVLVV